MPAPIIWEVTPAQWESLTESVELLNNAAISQQDYLERLRSMGMPTAGPGTHVRIVLRAPDKRITLTTSPGALHNGLLPGLPH